MRKTLSYSSNEAVVCAELSNLVYSLPYRIRLRINDIIENTQISIRTLSHGNLRILVVENESEIYVVFRGTDPSNRRSVTANLKCFRDRWQKGKVHKGFLGLLRHAKPFYMSKLKQSTNRTKTIYFTGHSQGGAVSFLATMDRTYPIRNDRLYVNYTFGQPRTGNKHFCRSAESRLGNSCIRIANGRDFFVGVPFVWQGYDHIRHYFHYRENSVITSHYQSVGESWPLFTSSFKDHSMTNYLKAAKRNIGVTV